MKKFLLGTTALISLSAASAAMAGGSHAPAAAAPANTGGLTVMVGGNFNFQSAMIDQDETVGGALANTGSADLEFRNDTTINITAAGSTEDFDYGAVVEMEGDSSADKYAGATSVAAPTATGSDTVNSDKTYLYIENDSFGRVEAGATAGVSQTMEVDASNIARATGGIGGDSLINVDTAGTQTLDFIRRPNLSVADADYTHPDSNKITYYTPRFSGFQLGASFTPESDDSGTAFATASDVDGGYENVISAGLGFEGDVADGVTLMAAAVGEWGDAQSTTFGTAPAVEDLSAYSLGLGVEFEGFSVAGNWANLGDSGTAIANTTGEDDGTYWTLGAAYENGPYGVSVTYLDSSRGTGLASAGTVDTGEHELTNLVVGADYQMAPGLTPYVEASWFDMNNGSTAAAFDNSGNTVLVGAEVAF